MKKLILASNNKKKINEMKEMLREMPIEVRSLGDENIDIDVEEDGKTFEENAKKKAEEIYKYMINKGEKNFLVLSDDSGLCVEALNNEPGIYSARYAGEHGNDKKNNEKLLLNLKGIKNRKAKFICQLALFTEHGDYYPITGEVSGHIIEEIKGEGGFGYDPLFFYTDLNETFGEISSEQKNKISHRSIALKELKNIISCIIKQSEG